MGMRILVTGGTGFIGSHLTNHLTDEGHEVIVVGTKTEQMPRAAKYLGLHLSNGTYGQPHIDRLKRLGNIDVIFHQAANNDTLDQDRDEMMFANFEAPKAFISDVVNYCGCRKLVYASSSAVYGNSPAPYVEGETPEIPLNPYAESKIEFDKWAMQFGGPHGWHNMKVVGLRYTNVYGPGEDHKGKRASMIHQLVKTMAKGDSPNLFWDGTQLRDWVYIKDVVRANLTAMHYKGKSGIFNCGSGKAASFNQLIDAINKKLGKDIHPTWIDCPFKAAYQTFTQAEMTKSKEVLGHAPAYTDIQWGINEMIDAL